MTRRAGVGITRRWRPLAFLGTLSYGIYILHRFPMPALQRLGMRPGIELFVTTATITVGVATISWYAFERPIISLKRYWPMPRARGAGVIGAAVAGADLNMSVDGAAQTMG